MKIKVHVYEPVSLMLICILFTALPNFLLATEQYSVETNVFWERERLYIAPCGDIDNDSIDELISILADFTLQPQRQDLSSCMATRVFDKGTFNEYSLCGGIDENNMYATTLLRDSLFLFNVWQGKKFLIGTGKDINPPAGWLSEVRQMELSDINSDGKLEAILNVVTGWDLRPRGIYVLDWNSGHLLWNFLSGSIIHAFSLRDIDGDSKQEILCGTHAVSNGCIGNNLSDKFSYAFILNSDGQIRWVHEVGHYSSIADAQWLINRKTGEYKAVIFEKGSSAGKRECDSIFILNGLTGEVITKSQYGQFNHGGIVINDNKLPPIIVLGGTDDTLRILDENLSLKSKRYINGDGCQYIYSGYFTGRSVPEIIVITTNGRLILYDLKLNILAQIKIGELEDASLVKYKNKSRFLIHINRDNHQMWQLIGFNITPLLSRRIPIVTVIIGTILLLALFVIGMIYARYTKTRDIRTVIKGLTGKSGVIEMNHKGEIYNISPKAREIFSISDKDKAQILKKLTEIKQFNPILELAKSMLFDAKISSPQEIAMSLGQEQSYLARCIRVKKGVLITFEDISAVEYLKRITSWAPVAQKLAHGIKTPLMNIQLSAQQLESACEPVKEKTDKIIEGIKSEAKRLRKLTDNFMRFTQFASLNLSSENINDILNDLCNKYSFTIPERIKINCELSSDVLKVMVDRKEVETALSIIIDNAVEAIVIRDQGTGNREETNKGILSIRTLMSEKLDKEKIKKYVVIEISDTGKGIPEKYKSELFKPYFTYGKPEGTGLGLTLAKKIIESHNGSIEIQSKENVGTTVSIYLPI